MTYEGRRQCLLIGEEQSLDVRLNDYIRQQSLSPLLGVCMKINVARQLIHIKAFQPHSPFLEALLLQYVMVYRKIKEQSSLLLLQ